MSGLTEVTGLILEVRPVGDYDRRIVLLTKERGKIAAFARGARKPGSPLQGTTDVFCFGRFSLFSGRDSYSVADVSVTNYFAYFRNHMEDALLAGYFCEVLSYCTRENNDEKEMLLLAYQTLKALSSDKYRRGFVRSVFELRTVVNLGEFPGLPPNAEVLPATEAAVQAIASYPVAKLYSFVLEREPERELAGIARRTMQKCFLHEFKSLGIVETILGDEMDG